MSQEKVDRYKQEKANRKKMVKKAKIQNVIRKCIVGIAALLLVGWIGYSAYGIYDSNKETEEIMVDYQSFNDLTQKLSDAAAADAEAAK